MQRGLHNPFLSLCRPPEGGRKVRWKDWMERAGISLKRMSELTGYDKTTLWHAINDGRYRKRLSRKFWGKIGSTVRWRLKPLALQMTKEGITAIRCPHCRTIFRVRVRTKTNIEIEPIVPEATKVSKTMSK
jgi:predicted DNA-binding transcriptional regulator AlpA